MPNHLIPGGGVEIEDTDMTSGCSLVESLIAVGAGDDRDNPDWVEKKLKELR